LLVGAGAALWVLSLSIGTAAATGRWEWRSPFELNPGKTLWSLPSTSGGTTAGALAATAWRNAGELARRVAVRVEEPTHYSPLFGIPGEPVRYLPGAVTALASIGLVGLAAAPRRKEAGVLLSWVAVAILPGVMSTDPEARRVATLFPALAAVAGIAAGEILRAARVAAGERGGRLLRGGAAPAALAGFAVVCGAFYFRQTLAVPNAVAMAQSIARHLSPGALVIADLDGNYDTRNRVTFLLFDRLGEGRDPPAWRTAAAGDWPEVAWLPRADVSQFQYASSSLAARASGLSGRERWSRCVWVVHDLPGNARKLELLKALYPAATEARERPVPDDRYFDFTVVEVAWDDVAALARREERHDGGTLMHAALYAPGPAWASLRSSRPGAALTVDGRTTAPGEEVLVARGVHEVVVRAGPGAALPDVQTRTGASRSPQPVPAGLLVSPALAAVGVLRAWAALEDPGFLAADGRGAVTKGVFTHVAVAPDGEFVALKILSDGWRVEVLDRHGAVAATWARRIAGRTARDSAAVAIAGGRSVAVLDVDVVARFDFSGLPLAKLRLPFECVGEEDLAADEDGDLFVVSGALDYVARIPADGGAVDRLAPPAGFVPGRWTPMRVAAARTGVVAAVDAGGTIHVFGRAGGGWRWVRALDPGWSGRPTAIAAREDGWIVAYYPSVAEWRVFDGEGAQRVALDPDHDLNTLLRPNIPVLAGFDRLGRLWAWFGDTGTVARLAPREAPGAGRTR